MARAYRIGKIEVQPDRLAKLPGKNKYVLLRLKRAIVDGSVTEGDTSSRFKLILDERAGLLTVDAGDSPYSGMGIGIAFMKEFVRLSRVSEPMLPTGGDENAPRYVFAVDTPINVLGLLHHIREQGGFAETD